MPSSMYISPWEGHWVLLVAAVAIRLHNARTVPLGWSLEWVPGWTPVRKSGFPTLWKTGIWERRWQVLVHHVLTELPCFPCLRISHDGEVGAMSWPQGCRTQTQQDWGRYQGIWTGVEVAQGEGHIAVHRTSDGPFAAMPLHENGQKIHGRLIHRAWRVLLPPGHPLIRGYSADSAVLHRVWRWGRNHRDVLQAPLHCGNGGVAICECQWTCTYVGFSCVQRCCQWCRMWKVFLSFEVLFRNCGPKWIQWLYSFLCSGPDQQECVSRDRKGLQCKSCCILTPGFNF